MVCAVCRPNIATLVQQGVNWLPGVMQKSENSGNKSGNNKYRHC